MMLDYKPRDLAAEGGFTSLSPEQQSHLLKWAALLPPSYAAAIPCAVSSASYTSSSSWTEDESSEGCSTFSLSSLSSPDRSGARREGGSLSLSPRLYAASAANSSWLLPAMDLFTVTVKTSPNANLFAPSNAKRD